MCYDPIKLLLMLLHNQVASDSGDQHHISRVISEMVLVTHLGQSVRGHHSCYMWPVCRVQAVTSDQVPLTDFTIDQTQSGHQTVN